MHVTSGAKYSGDLRRPISEDHVHPEPSGDTAGSSLEQALSAVLRERTARGGATLDLPVFDGGVFLPGIDPLDTSALLDIV